MRAVRIGSVGAPLVDADIAPVPPGPLQVMVEVGAAGICHSDVHYRRGPHTVDSLPLTLGHEVAGTIVEVGARVDPGRVGERVCLHYQTSCGACPVCARSEQFCQQGRMLGKGFDGGYAEYTTIDARNAFPVPDGVALEHAAVMMCSSATALHAIRKGRFEPGQRVAVFGTGGLGLSAVQIARAWGAAAVVAVDLDPDRLELASRLGAHPLDARSADPVEAIGRMGGVDLALELVGSPVTVRQAIDSVGILGRVVVVGISYDPIPLSPFAALAPREAELIGAMDHLAAEIPVLLDLAVQGELILDEVVGATVPLEASAINAVMDRMEHAASGPARTVIVP